MGTIATKDGTKIYYTQIYYREWGSGPAVVLSHDWPLTADGEAGEGCPAHRPWARASWHHRYAQGPAQRRSAGVPAVLSFSTSNSPATASEVFPCSA